MASWGIDCSWINIWYRAPVIRCRGKGSPGWDRSSGESKTLFVPQLNGIGRDGTNAGLGLALVTCLHCSSQIGPDGKWFWFAPSPAIWQNPAFLKVEPMGDYRTVLHRWLSQNKKFIDNIFWILELGAILRIQIGHTPNPNRPYENWSCIYLNPLWALDCLQRQSTVRSLRSFFRLAVYVIASYREDKYFSGNSWIRTIAMVPYSVTLSLIDDHGTIASAAFTIKIYFPLGKLYYEMIITQWQAGSCPWKLPITYDLQLAEDSFYSPNQVVEGRAILPIIGGMMFESFAKYCYI